MTDWLRLLEFYEPTISAIVGLLTLVAAAWGFVQLIIMAPRRIKQGETEYSAAGARQGYLRRLWTALIDHGLNTKTDLLEQVSVRTFNVCVLLVAFASLVWLVATLLYGDLLLLTVLNFIAFTLAITAYNLQAMGLSGFAKWLFLGLAGFYWAMNIVIMGANVGLEYFLGALLLLPLLMFRREQRRQRVIAVSLYLIALPVALTAQEIADFNLPAAYQQVIPNYYYANSMILAGLVFWILYLFNGAADSSFRKLEDRYEKTDELLNRLLPAYIAERYNTSDGAIADWHSEAGVLFVTVQGFETLYAQLSAVQLVEVIRQLFGDFDLLLEEHGIEKVNTLGVSYLAATGIAPGTTPNHVGLARAAIGMRNIVDNLSEATGHKFSLRAGISTGDVVSGVIGEARPNFDIWGRTVELAEKMRRDSTNNTIIVNSAAYWRLRSSFAFKHSEANEAESALLYELDKTV